MIESAIAQYMLAASDLGNLLYIIAILIFAVLGQVAKKWQERKQATAPKPLKEEIEEGENREERPWLGRTWPAPARRSPPVATPIRPAMPQRIPGSIPQATPTFQGGRPLSGRPPVVLPIPVGRAASPPSERWAAAWQMPRERLEAPTGVRIASKAEGLRQPIPSVKTAAGTVGSRPFRNEPGLVRPAQRRALITRGDFTTAVDLRRAFLMAEVLGPPLVLRGGASPLGPLGGIGA